MPWTVFYQHEDGRKTYDDPPQLSYGETPSWEPWFYDTESGVVQQDPPPSPSRAEQLANDSPHRARPLPSTPQRRRRAQQLAAAANEVNQAAKEVNTSHYASPSPASSHSAAMAVATAAVAAAVAAGTMSEAEAAEIGSNIGEAAVLVVPLALPLVLLLVLSLLVLLLMLPLLVLLLVLTLLLLPLALMLPLPPSFSLSPRRNDDIRCITQGPKHARLTEHGGAADGDAEGGRRSAAARGDGRRGLKGGGRRSAHPGLGAGGGVPGEGLLMCCGALWTPRCHLLRHVAVL